MRQDLPTPPAGEAPREERLAFLDSLEAYLLAGQEYFELFVTHMGAQDLLVGHICSEFSMTLSSLRTLRRLVELEG